MRFGAVADDRPVALGRRELLCGGGDRRAHGRSLDHRVGQRAQGGEHALRSADGVGRRLDAPRRTGEELVRDGDRQEEARPRSARRRPSWRPRSSPRRGRPRCRARRRRLSVRSLLRRFTIDTTAAPRDRDQVDGAVGVGGGARLADRHDERVGHVGAQPKPESSVASTESTWTSRPSTASASARAKLCRRPPRCPGRWRRRVGSCRRASRSRSRRAACRRPSSACQPAVALDELAAQRLAERGGRLGDLLEQVVRRGAPVDVAGGDLRGEHLVLGRPAARCRRRTSRVEPREGPGAAGPRAR